MKSEITGQNPSYVVPFVVCKAVSREELGMRGGGK